ncbi:hypothetical protein [Streptomyces collinus]
MGACLEPTAAMGPYRVEMRGQSFYLTRTGTPPEARAGRYEAVLPFLDFRELGAAADQITGHPDWARWEEAGRPAPADTSWTLPPDGTGPAAPDDWEITEETADGAHQLRIRGPWIVQHEPGRELWSAEIGYSDLPAFLWLVTRTAYA